MRLMTVLSSASLFLAPGLLISQAGLAVTLDSARVSPDITVVLGGQLLNDEDVGADDLAGTVAPVALGALPTGAGLAAYHLADNGDQLFVLDITAQLGAVTADPRDVVRYDGVDYSIEFDGSAAGLPSGARVDALSMAGDSHLLLSFDVTVALDGATFADEDLAHWDGADFTLFFDASAAGIDPALDLDAAHFIADQSVLILSFDGTGTASATTFADEDLLQYDLNATAWAMAYDGSARHADWVSSDLEAAFVTVAGDLIFMDGFESP